MLESELLTNEVELKISAIKSLYKNVNGADDLIKTYKEYEKYGCTYLEIKLFINELNSFLDFNAKKQLKPEQLKIEEGVIGLRVEDEIGNTVYYEKRSNKVLIPKMAFYNGSPYVIEKYRWFKDGNTEASENFKEWFSNISNKAKEEYNKF